MQENKENTKKKNRKNTRHSKLTHKIKLNAQKFRIIQKIIEKKNILNSFKYKIHELKFIQFKNTQSILSGY